MTAAPAHPSAAEAERFAEVRLRGLSSMATRGLLAELGPLCAPGIGTALDVASLGGVDVLRRVQAGEPVDLVFLASDAIDRLVASGHLQEGSRVDLVRSEVAVAVPEGATLPDLRSESTLREAVLAAPQVSYSTGPSGVAVQALFERWGLGAVMKARTVVAPPGVPVAAILASGQAALGFQQLSELMGEPGIQVAGLMPPDARITTVFSGAISVHTPHADAARQVLAFLASDGLADIKRQHGMDPA
jgi:molybdate transport system substrate-binding protein